MHIALHVIADANGFPCRSRFPRLRSACLQCRGRPRGAHAHPRRPQRDRVPVRPRRPAPRHAPAQRPAARRVVVQRHYGVRADPDLAHRRGVPDDAGHRHASGVLPGHRRHGQRPHLDAVRALQLPVLPAADAAVQPVQLHHVRRAPVQQLAEHVRGGAGRDDPAAGVHLHVQHDVRQRVDVCLPGVRDVHLRVVHAGEPDRRPGHRLRMQQRERRLQHLVGVRPRRAGQGEPVARLPARRPQVLLLPHAVPGHQQHQHAPPRAVGVAQRHRRRQLHAFRRQPFRCAHEHLLLSQPHRHIPRHDGTVHPDHRLVAEGGRHRRVHHRLWHHHHIAGQHGVPAGARRGRLPGDAAHDRRRVGSHGARPVLRAAVLNVGAADLAEHDAPLRRRGHGAPGGELHDVGLQLMVPGHAEPDRRRGKHSRQLPAAKHAHPLRRWAGDIVVCSGQVQHALIRALQNCKCVCIYRFHVHDDYICVYNNGLSIEKSIQNLFQFKSEIRTRLPQGI